jgi:5-methylcytosine-specific restriction endonuclease McrA
MTRATPEWIGRDDNEAVPPRVRVRVWDRANGHCQNCTRKIAAGERWVADHILAIINGGANREKNLQLLCDWCDRKVKTPADVAEKKVTARKKGKHIGAVSKPKKPFPGGRGSKFKQKIGGGVVYRETGETV